MRESWDSYFLSIAQQVATRSTCDRKHVGAVLVRDRTILSTGYNGSVRGMPHCDDVGHMMMSAPQELDALIVELQANVDTYGIQSAGWLGIQSTGWLTQAKKAWERLQHCEATVHAEANAIAQAAKNGVRIEGAVIYTTAFPCWGCTKLLLNAGVSHCFYGEAYRVDPRVTQAWGGKLLAI